MNPRILLLVPVLLLPLSFRAPVQTKAPAPSSAWKVDPVHSAVLYRIKHLDTSFSIGRFNGISGTLAYDEAKPEESSVKVEIDASSVDTNYKQREDHLRSPDFFSVKEFPKITFTSAKVGKSGDGYDVSGELSLHGVKKTISFKAQKTGASDVVAAGGPRIGFFAETSIKRSEFGMKTMLEGASDEVGLTLAIECTH